MEIYQKLDLINKSPKSIVTIGTFDGCHRGHQDIIKKVISLSQSNNCKSVLITFDPHPRHILESSNNCKKEQPKTYLDKIQFSHY